LGKTAFVFPGQGAQALGMGLDVYENHSEARARFDEADQVLGFPLTEIIFRGPEEKLKQTANTQPALLATSIALYEVFKANGIKPDYVAGHSLGEYSALVVAGVLDYATALKLVNKRGIFMEEAVPSGRGGMAAVLGADPDRLAALCEKISAETAVVEMANMNCPGQIVVSGEMKGVEEVARRAAEEAGARRVVPLEVSGPFHSSLMEPAAARLKQELDMVDMKDAQYPLVANVTARPVTQAEEIRSLLVKQVRSPVLWEQSIEWLVASGVDTFIEIGPGKVLAGLIRKIDRSAKVINIHDLDSAQQVIG
jgi:[acyl-carrier-protein] S-malonyltransferase